MEIGKRLKFFRALYGLTQTEVAEKAGINEKYYGRIERDESVPTLDKVEMLCQAFDIRMIDLFAPLPPLIRDTDKPTEDPSFERRVYYCNCCGTTFDKEMQEEIHCPNCQCEYDESNDYIEEITI